MTTKTPYELERALKKALIDLKVQTCMRELSKEGRVLQENIEGPLTMIISEQYDLKMNTLELFHTSHLSEKLFLETVLDDHSYIFKDPHAVGEKGDDVGLTEEEMSNMSAAELFDYANDREHK